MADPYETLGVQRTDSANAIRAAYRKLAKKHHPDLNPGKPEAEERFKAISAALRAAVRPDKRARYDRGEIDADRQRTSAAAPVLPPLRRRRPPAPAGATAPSQRLRPRGPRSPPSAASAPAGRAARPAFNPRGQDAHYGLTVSFLDAADGTSRRITLPEGRRSTCTIPAGTQRRPVLRLKGQGMARASAAARPGDALVEIAVAPHPLFRREGDDIIVELPVTCRRRWSAPDRSPHASRARCA